LRRSGLFKAALFPGRFRVHRAIQRALRKVGLGCLRIFGKPFRVCGIERFSPTAVLHPRSIFCLNKKLRRPGPGACQAKKLSCGLFIWADYSCKRLIPHRLDGDSERKTPSFFPLQSPPLSKLVSIFKLAIQGALFCSGPSGLVSHPRAKASFFWFVAVASPSLCWFSKNDHRPRMPDSGIHMQNHKTPLGSGFPFHRNWIAEFNRRVFVKRPRARLLHNKGTRPPLNFFAVRKWRVVFDFVIPSTANALFDLGSLADTSGSFKISLCAESDLPSPNKSGENKGAEWA